MSEIKKNIETCRGEDVLAEVSGLPQDPHVKPLIRRKENQGGNGGSNGGGNNPDENVLR